MEQELLGHDNTCPAEENVEAICQFFRTIGKQLDETKESRQINDRYFSRLKQLASNNQLPSRVRFMVRDLLDTRNNNWVPRREEVKAKTITEIHSEAEKNLGLRPGATASMRNGRTGGGGGSLGSPGPFPMNRPGGGGMMPGMPGTRRMPGMPSLDGDNWEIPKTKSMPKGDRIQPSLQQAKASPINSRLLPQGSGGLITGKTSALLQGAGGAPAARPLVSAPAVVEQVAAKPAAVAQPVVAPSAAKPSKINPVDLQKKTVSLLKEYFSVRDLNEARLCVEELKSPEFHSEVVKEAISLALEESPPCVEPIVKLLSFLFDNKVITLKDMGTGCLLYGSMLDDIAIDLPVAPGNFGIIVGRLILGGSVGLKVVEEILKKVEELRYRKGMFDSILKTMNSAPAGAAFISSHADEIKACESLLA